LAHLAAATPDQPERLVSVELSAADRARFETVRSSAPVASPAVDVPLDLDEDTETGAEGAIG
jgi:hypothetical protein